MGTSYDVLVEVGADAPDSVTFADAIERELTRVDHVMSTYDSSSDVSRFGAYRGSEAFSVDPTLLQALASGLEVSRRSGGAFDPTVGPLVDAWGFGPTDVLDVPDSTRVAALLGSVGYGRLVPDTAAGTLAKTDPLVGFDLSGVAKGFAAQRVVRALSALGCESALVDVGGELSLLGSHRDGRPWRVALEGPGAEAPEPVATVDLMNESVATSGDFRNFYEEDGRVYAHIIDPRTGFPIPYVGFSVSVVHPDGAMADAWATALTVLGPDDGYALAEREGLSALFAWRSPEGLSTRATEALGKRISLRETATDPR